MATTTKLEHEVSPDAHANDYTQPTTVVLNGEWITLVDYELRWLREFLQRHNN